MTDNLGTIFLSYSRQDAEQARKLEAALQAKGRLLWVDWNSIPPTAVWLEEIHRAIVAASAFAFAVSPGSVASDMCRLELDYAIRAGKRLIPLLFRETPSDLVPEGLKPIQWIDFTSQEDLAGPVHELLLAIDKDPTWVAFHTRLAIRAREWREDTQNSSLLFRGAELVRTERRVGENRFADPIPSEVQLRFLEASRWAARLDPVRAATVLGLAAFLSSFLVGLGLLGDTYHIIRTCIISAFACAAFALFRLSNGSYCALGMSLLLWYEALIYARRATFGRDWGDFSDAVSALIVGNLDTYEAGARFAIGSLVIFSSAVILACIGAKQSSVLKPLSVALAWCCGFAAASTSLLLLVTAAGSTTTDSMRIYFLLSHVIGYAAIGLMLGLLPLKTSALVEMPVAPNSGDKASRVAEQTHATGDALRRS